MAEKKDVRIGLVMSPGEVEALDAWRQERRIWSRSDAMRRLIAEGIARDAEPELARREREAAKKGRGE